MNDENYVVLLAVDGHAVQRFVGHDECNRDLTPVKKLMAGPACGRTTRPL